MAFETFDDLQDELEGLAVLGEIGLMVERIEQRREEIRNQAYASYYAPIQRIGRLVERILFGVTPKTYEQHCAEIDSIMNKRS